MSTEEDGRQNFDQLQQVNVRKRTDQGGSEEPGGMVARRVRASRTE